MKKLPTLFLLGVVCLLTWNCTKHTYDQSLPQVQMVSAALIGNDTLLVTGEVTNQGSTPIQNVGFAFSDQPNFDITSNQVLLNANAGSFSMYLAVSPDSTYYFKCFATNATGYTASNSIKYTVMPNGPQTAPCASSLSTNYVIDGFGYNMIDVFVYTGGSATYGNYELATDNGGNEVIDLFFNRTPTNGIYNIVAPINLSSSGNYSCSIEEDNSYIATSGSVYVAVSGSSITFTFCSVPYYNGSSNVSLSGKLVSP